MGNITRKGLSKLLSLSFLVITLMIAGAKPAVAAEGGGKTDFIMHHIQDSHEWHLLTLHPGEPDEHHVTIPLPIIIYNKTQGGLDVFMSSAFYNAEHKRAPYKGYELDSHDHIKALDGDEIMDLSITKNVASMLLSVILLLLIFIPVAKGYQKNANKAPKGIQSFFEPIITFVRDDIALPNIGKEKYEKFMPYLLSVFFFIWLNNLLGLLPGGANVTGNIAITFVLAVFTLIITNINGSKHYWGHILWMPGVPLPLKPLMAVIEIVGIFTKPFALMVRLFANITAGHIIILSIIGLIFILGSSAVGVASVPFAVAMNFLELLVAFIQAYVFTLLSAIFIGQAVEEHH